jgi:rod shape determining protein RodA
MHYKIEHQFLTKIKKFPATLLLLPILLASFGSVVLYSASGGTLAPWADKQIATFIAFFIIALVVALINIKVIYHIAYPFFIVNIILLILVYKFGYSAMGATRWINLFGLRIQPSELAKISIILFLARYLHDLKLHKRITIRQTIIPIMLCLIPSALIIKQPDLGTAIICIAILGCIFFVAGLKIRYFIMLFVAICAAFPFFWYQLHEYQKKRILIFLNPENDLLGAGYNIHQSKIAIGSGGIWGKGFLAGTQSHLNFLPEFQTDFAFALLCEEFGFIGVIILLTLYFLLISRYVVVSANCSHVFGKVLVAGSASMIFLHCFINIAMVMGLLPVVGVPLPFISYGGTMMAVLLIGLGLVLNVHIHSNKKYI